MNNKNTGIFYGMYILSMLLFGTNGYLVSHISLQSSQIVLVRTLIGGLVLSAMVLLQKDFSFSRIKPELGNLLAGGIALGLNRVTLFAAYRMLNVSLATLIYYAGPMLVLLFSPWLFREKLTKQKLAAVMIVAAGLLCITGSIAAGKLSMAGLFTAIASALFYASLILFNKRIRNTGGLQTAAVELDVAFVVVLLYVLFALPDDCRYSVPSDYRSYEHGAGLFSLFYRYAAPARPVGGTYQLYRSGIGIIVFRMAAERKHDHAADCGSCFHYRRRNHWGTG